MTDQNPHSDEAVADKPKSSRKLFVFLILLCVVLGVITLRVNSQRSAKKWVDFALTADVQSLAVKARAYQVPSNKGATVPPEAPDVSSIKLIDYDHGKYGSKAERTRLLAKWDREVKVLPR